MTDNGRLAEILGGLSVATDLAAAVPIETALRTSVIAVRLARLVSEARLTARDTYYCGLLRFIGCTAFATEMSRHGAGDDLALMAALTPGERTRPPDALARAAKGINPGATRGQRALGLFRLATNPGLAAGLARSHCDLAVVLARQIGMSGAVVEALGQMYERWDGRGAPAKLKRAELRPEARILHVAWRVAVHLAIEGASGAREVLQQRRGGEFDPAIADVALEQFDAVTRGLFEPTLWTSFLEEEPVPHLTVEAARLRDIAVAFGHFADAKFPFAAAHAASVANLAERAAERLGLDAAAAQSVFVAASLHDLGQVGLPNGLLEKRGPLTEHERERVAAHTLETERILKRSRLLARFATLAAAHHERLDGSGYHRRIPGSLIDTAARVVAAADVWSALTCARPHRPAMTPEAAAKVMADEVKAGRLCPHAVEAVVTTAGATAPRMHRALPAGLSAREAEVLALASRGRSNKEIGAALFIAPGTVKRHLENAYLKLGVKTRAAAAVVMAEHGLLQS